MEITVEQMQKMPTEDWIKLAKNQGWERHRCCNCGKLSYFTHSVNGSPWFCYDNCKSTNLRISKIN